MTATWCWISAHIKTTNVNKLRIIIAPDRHKPGYECPTFTSDHDNVSKKNMREEEVSPIQPNEGHHRYPERTNRSERRDRPASAKLRHTQASGNVNVRLHTKNRTLQISYTMWSPCFACTITEQWLCRALGTCPLVIGDVQVCEPECFLSAYIPKTYNQPTNRSHKYGCHIAMCHLLFLRQRQPTKYLHRARQCTCG